MRLLINNEWINLIRIIILAPWRSKRNGSTIFCTALFSSTVTPAFLCTENILAFLFHSNSLFIDPSSDRKCNKQRCEVRAAQQLFATSGPHSLWKWPFSGAFGALVRFRPTYLFFFVHLSSHWTFKVWAFRLGLMFFIAVVSHTIKIDTGLLALVTVVSSVAAGSISSSARDTGWPEPSWRNCCFVGLKQKDSFCRARLQK